MQKKVRCVLFKDEWSPDKEEPKIIFPAGTILIVANQDRQLEDFIYCQWKGNELRVPRSIVVFVELDFPDLLNKYNDLLRQARPVLQSY